MSARSRITLGLLVAFGLGCGDRAKDAPPPSESATATATATSTAGMVASADTPPPDVCGEVEGVDVHVSPRSPRPGVPLRWVSVSRSGAQLKPPKLVRGDASAKREVEVITALGHGPPSWVSATLSMPVLGAYTLQVPTDRGLHCHTVEVTEEVSTRPKAPWSAVWPYEHGWDERYEGLYGAWLEHLFDAPLSEQPVWKALYEALRDPKRNLLHNHLGLKEDDPEEAPNIEPDCADLPYTLRAYFAYKLSLPFGYSRCTRGTSRSAPACRRWSSSLTANDGSTGSVRRLGNFLRVKLANAVHSGTVRVRGEDDEGDYYPVKLDATTLRPGTVFADPYGHILVLVKRVPQTETSGGLLLAVDGQPDATVSRRRFWRGNFLFDDDPVFGGPGFKRFRPVVLEEGKPRALTNAEIMARPGYGDYGLEQYGLGIDGFYEHIDTVLSPKPRDPKQAFLETITALEEQVVRRVVSVDNGVARKKERRGIIDMPEGPEIFQTTGDWEDFSTPSRDMRLLIAMDVVLGWPSKAAAHPERWVAPGEKPRDGATLKAELEALLAAETKKRTFSYTRSDGSAFTLSLAEVLDRRKGFEMAYNPNDCPERRWAAPDESPEAKTCRLHAPAGQRRRMTTYRPWFEKRQRPPQ